MRWGSPKDHKGLLNLLGDETVRLPSALRFIFTNRQELNVQKTFEDERHLHVSRPRNQSNQCKYVCVLVRELDITSSENYGDITSFFRHQLSVIHSYSDSLALDWPNHGMVYI